MLGAVVKGVEEVEAVDWIESSGFRVKENWDGIYW